jgi:hypothetical protein
VPAAVTAAPRGGDGGSNVVLSLVLRLETIVAPLWPQAVQRAHRRSLSLDVSAPTESRGRRRRAANDANSRCNRPTPTALRGAGRLALSALRSHASAWGWRGR